MPISLLGELAIGMMAGNRKEIMGLIDVLRKLGILRFGAEKAVYHNAKERPVSLQDEGVFNSSKDVIDLNKKAAPSGK
jgi:hypothetical protein